MPPASIPPVFAAVFGIELVVSLEIQIALHAGDREQVADLRTDADNSAVWRDWTKAQPVKTSGHAANMCIGNNMFGRVVPNSAVPSQKVDHRRWATPLEFVYDIRHRALLYGCDAGVMGRYKRPIALCDPARASPTQIGLLPADPIGPNPTTISSLGEGLPFLPMRSMPTWCSRGVRLR